MNGRSGCCSRTMASAFVPLKPGHGVVRDHEVPLGFAELAAQIGGRVYTARENVVSGARKRRHDQSRIILRVFDLQQP